MITTNDKNQVDTAGRIQLDHLGRRLPLAGTDYQTPAAPFDGGCA